MAGARAGEHMNMTCAVPCCVMLCYIHDPTTHRRSECDPVRIGKKVLHICEEIQQNGNMGVCESRKAAHPIQPTLLVLYAARCRGEGFS